MPAVGLDFKRLGDEGLGTLWAKRADGAPDGRGAPPWVSPSWTAMAAVLLVMGFGFDIHLWELIE